MQCCQPSSSEQDTSKRIQFVPSPTTLYSFFTGQFDISVHGPHVGYVNLGKVYYVLYFS